MFYVGRGTDPKYPCLSSGPYSYPPPLSNKEDLTVWEKKDGKWIMIDHNYPELTYEI